MGPRQFYSGEGFRTPETKVRFYLRNFGPAEAETSSCLEFYGRRLGRIPSWPLAKKRSGIPLSRACSFLPRSKDRGTGFLLYGATHDLAVKIHVSYEAVQHAKKHGLTDNRVSENRSGTNDLLSTRATNSRNDIDSLFKNFPYDFLLL